MRKKADERAKLSLEAKSIGVSVTDLSVNAERCQHEDQQFQESYLPNSKLERNITEAFL